MEYISSRKVNDWRYRGTSDGIMTTFFKGYYQEGEGIACDDIFEVRWFYIQELKDDDLVGEHVKLLNDLKQRTPDRII